MRKAILFAIFVCMNFMPAASHAQATRAAAFDTSRMQRDLEIMEAILDRLFDRAGASFQLAGEGSRGIYMPGFGVFFQVPKNEFSFHFFMETPSPKGSANAPVVAPEAREARARNRLGVRQRLGRESLREDLQSFFANYADAIGQLDNNERIAVYIHGSANFAFAQPGVTAFATRSGNSRDIFAAARKADVVARRSGTLAPDEFNKRLLYRESSGSEEDADLEVMARIIDAALRGKSKTPGMLLEAETRPIYLDGVGAMFLLRASVGAPNVFQILEAPRAPDGDELLDIERQVIALQSASKRAKSDWKTEYGKFRSRLAEIIADYGHTLRRLQRDEWVVIAADLRDAPEGGPQELVCRAKKQDIDAYNSRSISRDQLINRIDYFEY
jgi:hypothetical protein